MIEGATLIGTKVQFNRAIKRIGAKHEGVLRKERILHDGYIRDTNTYSIIEEEWPEVKARFEQQLLKA